jgi:hypothetical protein
MCGPFLNPPPLLNHVRRHIQKKGGGSSDDVLEQLEEEMMGGDGENNVARKLLTEMGGFRAMKKIQAVDKLSNKYSDVVNAAEEK